MSAQLLEDDKRISELRRSGAETGLVEFDSEALLRGACGPLPTILLSGTESACGCSLWV